MIQPAAPPAVLPAVSSNGGSRRHAWRFANASLARPGNRGLRLSANAATPSRASADAPRAAMRRLSRRWREHRVVGAEHAPHQLPRQRDRHRCGVLGDLQRRRPRALASSSSAGTTRCTRPPACASSAGTQASAERPLQRAADARPHAAGTSSRTRRARCRGVRRRSRSVRRRRRCAGPSAAVMAAPMPTAAPLTAAISGLVLANSRSASTPPPSRPGSSPAGGWRRLASNDCGAARQVEAGAEGARAGAGEDDRAHASSPSARSKRAQSSRRIVRVIAFSCGGRFSVIVSTGPSCSSSASRRSAKSWRWAD